MSKSTKTQKRAKAPNVQDTIEVYLPENRRELWGSGNGRVVFKLGQAAEAWWTPVRYFTEPRDGYRKVAVPAWTCQNGWFHPERHENLPALAELLS